MVKKRGLGKSLDALLEGSSLHASVDPASVSIDNPSKQLKEKLCNIPIHGTSGLIFALLNTIDWYIA